MPRCLKCGGCAASPPPCAAWKALRRCPIGRPRWRRRWSAQPRPTGAAGGPVLTGADRGSSRGKSPRRSSACARPPTWLGSGEAEAGT
eukprot:255761-Lingulodinium_polyedra.AAC.1